MSSALKRVFRGSPGCGTYLFAFVFLVRLLALARLTSSPFLLPSGSDMHFYDDWARQILQGHLSDGHAFYGLPLYPWLLAFLYRLFGFSPFVPGLFQVCLEAGTAVLIYKITVAIFRSANFGERETAANVVGLGAAAGWIFFISAQAYSVILMPTAGSVFVFWLLVWQIVRTPNALSALRCFSFGLLIGVAAMGVASILFLIPLVLAALYLRPVPGAVIRSFFATRTAAIGLFVVGLAAGTSPCWIHNYLVARDPVFLSAHGGINFWLGNNPEATGYPHFPGMHAGQTRMLRDSIDLAETAAGKSLKRSQVSEYWSSKARDYIVTHPGAWLKLMARKFANFWNAFEYDDLGVIRNLREHGVVFPGLHFGLVAVLAIPGLLFSWRAFPASRWIAAAIGLHLAAILPVFVTERYRLPVVPGLLIFAVLGLQRLWSYCSLGKYRSAALHLGVVAAGALFVTLPRHDPSLWALEAYNSGRSALELNDLPLAERHLLRAQAFIPDSPETNFALGNLRLAQDDRPSAERYYEQTLRLDPQHKAALNNLGILFLDEKRWHLAEAYFDRALAQAPRNAKTHFLLARAKFGAGEYAAAEAELVQALALQPDQPEFLRLRDEIRAQNR